MSGKFRPAISVLTRLDRTIEAGHWQRFAAGLAGQTFQDFEVVAGVAPGTALPETDVFRLRQVELDVKDSGPALDLLARSAGGQLAVLLEADSRPLPGLLAAYARSDAGAAALVGREIPALPDRGFGTGPEFKPEPAGEENGQPLPFSAFRLTNLALPVSLLQTIAAGLPDTGEIAALAAGWRVGQAGVDIKDRPAAACLISPVRRWASRLSEHSRRGERLDWLRRELPELAGLYEQLERPAPAMSSRVLLYDTIRDYPITEGMLAGLQEHFGLANYEQLRQHPLFAGVSRAWEARRDGYLQAQLERLDQGQAELERYAGHVSEALRQQQTALEQARRELAVVRRVLKSDKA